MNDRLDSGGQQELNVGNCQIKEKSVTAKLKGSRLLCYYAIKDRTAD